MDYFEEEEDIDILSDDEYDNNENDDMYMEQRCQQLYDLYVRVLESHAMGERPIYVPGVMRCIRANDFVEKFAWCR